MTAVHFEITVYDEMLARFRDAAEPALRERVAGAMVNKGVRLGQLNRSEDAIAVFDELLAHFGDAAEPAFRARVARSAMVPALRKIVEETTSLQGFNDTPGESL
jgi:hypothetical protein